MNAELFSYYLIDTSKLRELGYQDLENLIERFPFCQNLHYLIAKKSHIENHPDFEKWLHKAATYSTDRSYLYQLLHEVDFEKDYAFEEEKFDLDTLLVEDKQVEKLPISQEEPELILLEKEEAKVEKELVFAENSTETKIDYTEEESSTDADTQHEEEPLVTLSDLLKQEEEAKIEEAAQINDIEPEKVEIPKPIAQKAVKPLPKSAFTSWKKKTEVAPEPSIGVTIVSEEDILEHKRRIEEKIDQDASGKKKEKKTKKSSLPDGFVDRSLVHNEDIASETLAKILALQGRKSESIAMFEKLKLQIPEKSTYFAAEIEKLQ